MSNEQWYEDLVIDRTENNIKSEIFITKNTFGYIVCVILKITNISNSLHLYNIHSNVVLRKIKISCRYGHLII